MLVLPFFIIFFFALGGGHFLYISIFHVLLFSIPLYFPLQKGCVYVAERVSTGAAPAFYTSHSLSSHFFLFQAGGWVHAFILLLLSLQSVFITPFSSVFIFYRALPLSIPLLTFIIHSYAPYHSLAISSGFFFSFSSLFFSFACMHTGETKETGDSFESGNRQKKNLPPTFSWSGGFCFF